MKKKQDAKRANFEKVEPKIFRSKFSLKNEIFAASKRATEIQAKLADEHIREEKLRSLGEHFQNSSSNLNQENYAATANISAFFTQVIKHDFDELVYTSFDEHSFKSKLRRYRADLRQVYDSDRAGRIFISVLNLFLELQQSYAIALVRSKIEDDKQKYYETETRKIASVYDDLVDDIYKAFFIVLDKDWFPELAKFTGKLILYNLNTRHAFYSFSRSQSYRQAVNLEKEILYNYLENKLALMDVEVSNNPSLELHNLEMATQTETKTETQSETKAETQAKLDTELQAESLDGFYNADEIPMSFLRNFRTDSEKCDTGKSLLSKYITLINYRNKAAKELGFRYFEDYALKKQGYYDYDSHTLITFIKNVKKYLLPIHKAICLEKQERLQAEQSELNSNIFPNKSLKELQVYYKKVFAANDWEMRNLDEVIRALMDSQAKQTYFPASNNYIYAEDMTSFIEKLIRTANKVVDRNYRGYLEQLMDKSYIKIEENTDYSFPKAYTLGLGIEKLAVLYARANKSSYFISEFLKASGVLYSDLVRKKLLSNKHAFVTTSAETREFFGLAYELMALSRIEVNFGELITPYKSERIYALLVDILKNAAIYEFQYLIYSLEIEDEEYGEILLKNIWRKLEDEYELTLYTDELLSERLFKDELLQAPFSSITHALVEVTSLNLMFKFMKNRRQARVDFEKFCALSGEDSFIEVLGLANIDNPLNIDTIKILAYKLSKFLEE